MFSSLLKRLLPVLCLLLFAASGVTAQETRATLSGTVTDSSQAAVANGTVRLTNLSTSETATVTTNALGQYRFLYVNPGSYRLRADAPGFQTYVQTGIVLNVSQASTIDITLTIGSQTQTVTVNAGAQLLETEKSDRGVVIDNRNLSELPITTRNPIVLAELVPGVTNTGQSYNLTPFSNSGNSSFSINGDTGDATENLLDGAPNDMIYQNLNSIAYVPPVDAVDEFKVITAPYDASYGRNGGGVISVVTKTGTNSLHGTAYEFMERPFLNANTYANNAAHLARSNSRLDQFGATIGGPVVLPKLYNGHDKTFFFTAWEGYLQNINLSTVISVPTAAQRAGDFSQTFNSQGNPITIYDPASGHYDASGSWVRDPFPGNKIPQNRIDPVGQAMANAYPMPNQNQTSTVNWQNNYYPGSNITWYHFYNFITRLDHSFSEKERIYGRYAWNNQVLFQNTNEVPGMAGDLRQGLKSNHDAVFDSITVLSPNLMLDLRASLTRWTQNYAPTNYGSFNGTQIGWNQALVNQLQEPARFPYVTATDYESLGNSANNIWFAPTTVLTAEPTLRWTKGRHQIGTGFDYRWTRFNTFQGAYGGGTFAITQAFTQQNYLTSDALSGNSIATMLLGGAASGEADVLANPYYSWKYYGIWAQDDIKVTSRLTVNAGIRWDIQDPVIERHNEITRGFDTAAVNPISAQMNAALYPNGGNVYGGLAFAGVGGQSRSPFNMDLSNIQPRIGADYRVTPSFVLRGGWGIFYVPQYSTATSSGFSQATPFVSSLDSGKTQASYLSNPFPSGIQQPSGSSLGLSTLLGKNPGFSNIGGQIGHLQSFSFGFEKQLPARMMLDASYVGTRSDQLPASKNIDALPTNILALGNSDLGGSSTYLTAQVPNPFQGLLPGTSLNGATISRQQLLLPYPEFTAVTEGDIPQGKAWYNALQMALMQQHWHGLDTMVTYTFSKEILATSFLNPEDGLPAHTAAPWDRTHRLVVAPIYELPFGRNHTYFSDVNRFANTLISGWQAAGEYTWQTGAPMTTPTGVAIIGNPKLSNPSWNQMFNSGLKELNGTVVDAVNGLPPAWRILPPFALRTAPLQLGNLRDRWGNEFQLTAAKNNYFGRDMNLQLRAEFLNAFNHAIFGSDPVISTTSPQFGSLIRSNGQSNIPRTIQLAARLIF